MSIFSATLTIPGHGEVVGMLTTARVGLKLGLGLRPPILGLRPICAPLELLVHSRCFPDPTNPTTNPTRVSTGQKSTQGCRREVTHGHQQPSEARQRVIRAVTLALTLASPAAHSDSPTYTYMAKAAPCGPGEIVSSSLIGRYTSLNVYSVRTAHSKKVDRSIHQWIDLSTYGSRHL